jgi:hypothetical protein
MQHSNSDPAETPSWLEQRQAMVWEPELLISGIVLFGLLQIPSGLDHMQRYLNDWGASIIFLSNMDEFLDIGSMDRGLYRLELWLQEHKPRKVASISFYKVDEAEKQNLRSVGGIASE